MDRPSRFIPAWTSGKRTTELARTLVRTTRERTAGQVGIGWVSDGWTAYQEVIPDGYWDPLLPTPELPWDVRLPAPGVALTQAVKHRKGRRLERVEVRAVVGQQAAQPYTVHVERQNGVLRDLRLACLTRKTHAFAKTTATWIACFSLARFEHNWIQPHVALRQPVDAAAGRRYQQRTPAMALRLTDHVWPLTEFLTRPAYHGV